MPIHPMTLEMANMFCGSGPEDTRKSLHLKLADVKLPHFEEFYIDHRAGGAPVAIEIDVIYNKLTCEFTILGFDADVMATQRAWSATQNNFHFFGLLRDPHTGSAYKVEALIKGRLGKVEYPPWKRGDMFVTTCAIRGIIAYNLAIVDRQIYSWDFMNNTLKIGSPQGTPAVMRPEVQQDPPTLGDVVPATPLIPPPPAVPVLPREGLP